MDARPKKYAHILKSKPEIYSVLAQLGKQDTVFTGLQWLSRLCVQRVIWTPRTLFFDNMDTQRFLSEFADDDFS